MENALLEFTSDDLAQETQMTDLYINDWDNIAFVGKHFSGCSTSDGVKLIFHNHLTARAYRIENHREYELDNHEYHLHLNDFESVVYNWEKMALDNDTYKNRDIIDYLHHINNKIYNEWQLVYKDENSMFIENYDEYGVDRIIIYDINKFFTQVHDILKFAQEFYHNFR